MSDRVLSVEISTNLSPLDAGMVRAGSILEKFTGQVAALGNSFERLLTQPAQKSTDRTRSAFDKLTSSLSNTRSQLQNVLAKGGEVPDALRQKYVNLNAQVDSVNASIRRMTQTPTMARVSMPELPGPSGSVLSGLSSYATGMLSIGAAITTVKAGFGLVSDFERLDAGIKAVSSSTADFEHTQSLLKGQSNLLGISVEALEESYKGLKGASRGTALEGRETEKIFMAVSRAGAALKLSSDNVKGTLLALQQMMSKGTVSAEEMTQQLGERLPGSLKMASAAMGVTEGKLLKMMQNGEVMAVDLLPKLARELEKTYGSQAQANIEGMAGGWTRATDQLSLYIAEFSEQAGISSFFAKIGNGLADTMRGMRELQRQGRGGGIAGFIGGLMNSSATNAAERAGRLRDEFSGMDRPQQRARLEMLKEEVGGMTLSHEKLTYMGLLNDLTKEYNGLRRQSRRLDETRVNAPVDPIKELESKKKQYQLDIQMREGLMRMNKSVPGDVSKRIANYDAASKRIAESTKNKAEPSAYQAPTSGYDLNARLLNDLEKKAKDEVQRFGKVSEITTTRMEALRRIQKEADEAIKAQPATVFLQLTEQLGKLNDEAKDLNLTGKVAPPELIEKIRSLNAQLKKSEEYLAKIKKFEVPGAVDVKKFNVDGKFANMQRNYETDAENDNKGDVAQRQYTQLPAFIGRMATNVKAATTDFGAAGDAAREQLDTVVDMFKGFKSSINEGVAGIFSAIGEGLTTKSKNPFKAVLNDIIGALSGFVVKLGTTMLLSSKLLAGLSFLPGVGAVTLPLSINQGIAGAALIVGGSAIKAATATPFAEGGGVMGPTYSLLGEGRGISRQNPELAIPANKLKSFIMEMAPSGGNSHLTIGGRLKGSDLELQLLRQQRSDAHFYV